MSSAQDVRGLRILITMASWSSGASGGDMHALAVAGHWCRTQQVTVVCPIAAAPLVNAQAPSARVVTFAAVPLGDTPLGMAAAYLRRIPAAVRAARAAGPVDIALGASHFLPDIATIRSATAKLRSVYVYHLIHQHRSTDTLRSMISSSSERLTLHWMRSFVDTTFTCNQQTVDALGKRAGLAHTDVGVSLPSVMPEAGRGRRRYAASFLGRLVRTKGTGDLPHVFDAIRQRDPTARFAVIGAGPEYENVVRHASDLGLDRAIDWKGFASEADKLKTLSDSEVLLFPSYEEGWGIAVCEALGMSTPVVAYDLPVLREIFPVGVERVSVGDRDAMANAAINLLCDTRRREELGAAGAAFVRRYDLTTVADSELRVLIDALLAK